MRLHAANVRDGLDGMGARGGGDVHAVGMAQTRSDALCGAGLNARGRELRTSLTVGTECTR